MSRHLHSMDIDKVSLVDRGANGKKFALLKRAPMVSLPDTGTTTGTTDDVLQIDMKVQALAADEGGVRAALAKVAHALGIGKVDDFDDITANDVDSMSVAKVGQKQFSRARMSQLKDAFKVLGEVINGIESGYWTPPDSNGIEKGTDDMTIDEMHAAIDSRIAKAFEADGVAVAAIVKAVTDGITKSEASEAAEATTEATAEVRVTAPELPPSEVAPPAVTDTMAAALSEIATTNGQIIEAVAKLVDRTDALEGGRSQQATAADVQVATPVAKTSPLASLHGILG